MVPRGGKLVTAVTAPIATAHPAEVRIVEEGETLTNVYEPLVTTDQHGHLIPCLCESWDMLEGGKEFVFALRRNVPLHDGQPLTAAAVKSSFEKAARLTQNSLPAAYAAILGVQEYLNGSSDQITGIVIRSESKLSIQLKERLPIYPALLTDLRAGIACESKGSVTGFVGTGPFRIGSFASDHVLLERNPEYWKGKSALLDAVEFRTSMSSAKIAAELRSGEIDLARDLLPEDLEQVLRDERFKAGFVEAPKKNIYFALFNHSSQFGKLAPLRQALCGVVQTHDLVWRTIGRLAQPAEGLLPPGIMGHDPGRRRILIAHEKAAELLQSTGLSLPIRLKASVHPILQDRYSSLLNELFKLWADFGVQISVETPSMSAFLESWDKNENLDLILMRWIPDYDDPDNFIYPLFYSQGQLRKYYSSKQIDDLVNEARIEQRPETRERLYRKIEDVMIETGTLLPLFHEIDYRVGSPKVRKLMLNSSPPYVNYSELGKVEAQTVALARKTEGGVIHVPDIGNL
ncbi:MAG TPA: ABC transporter substrate-binding protein, partial [Acidobacteriota bacterium]|nr:ABC transporter substrate-binding protein [Acidobacteriota bacterium]